MGIDGCGANQVGTVETNAGKRVVDTGGDVERKSAGNAHEWSDLPVVGQSPRDAMQAAEVTGGDQRGVEDVTDVEAAAGAIETAVGGVLIAWPGDVAGGVAGADAMRPGVVGEEAEVVRHAVLDDSEDTVVAGVGAVVDLGH